MKINTVCAYIYPEGKRFRVDLEGAAKSTFHFPTLENALIHVKNNVSEPLKFIACPLSEEFIEDKPVKASKPGKKDAEKQK